MKYIIVLTLIFSSTYLSAQSPKRILKKIGDKPLYFIDSLNVGEEELMKYDPDQIALLTVIKSKEATEFLGDDGKDGAIYIETIRFSKSRYWKFFSLKSPEYAEIVPSAESDSNIQYILNDKILTEDYEGTLALINDDVFKDIKIIDKNTLEKEYKINTKEYGVLIKSDTPEDLYKGKKKF